MSQNPSYMAGEDLSPSVFATLDPSNDRTVLEAGVGDAPVGVTHEGSREAPIPSVTPLAAASGESCRVYGEDEECEVTTAAAIVNGEYVRPDASGLAIKARHGLPYGGRAIAAAASGEQCRIKVESGVFDNSRTILTKTDDYTALESDCGATIQNTGAADTITISLPAATTGMEYKFRVDAAQELRIDPDGTETIALPSTGVPGAAGKYLTANAVNETLHIRCNEAGTWDVLSYTGTWTAEA